MVRKVSAQELSEMLHKGTVKFQYTKKDGSVRQATGTLMSDVVKANLHGGVSTVKNAGYTSYFDIDKQAFRCFAESRLVGVVEG